jgi:Fe-S-cluster containining protein
MSEFKCKRCGKCCEHLSPGWFIISNHPLIVVFNKVFQVAEHRIMELDDPVLTDSGGCAMLHHEQDGKAVCLIHKYLGEGAKPESCREYPMGENFEGVCPGMKL